MILFIGNLGFVFLRVFTTLPTYRSDKHVLPHHIKYIKLLQDYITAIGKREAKHSVLTKHNINKQTRLLLN